MDVREVERRIDTLADAGWCDASSASTIPRPPFKQGPIPAAAVSSSSSDERDQAVAFDGFA